MDKILEQPKKLFTPFTSVAFIIFLLAIISNLYFFYFKKDYKFIVESACDPSREECFQRDCSNPDDCPPNQLSTFKRYSLKANNFKSCQNEDCTIACETGQIKCEKIKCKGDVDVGESCTSLVQ